MNNINRLVGDFMDLYASWEDDPAHFAWERLQALAKEGAQAYNAGLGPSFHILAFDGYPHGDFHERFLRYLLDAGFDPFMTIGSVPVFSHESLAVAAVDNPSSARMKAILDEMAALHAA